MNILMILLAFVIFISFQNTQSTLRESSFATVIKFFNIIGLALSSFLENKKLHICFNFAVFTQQYNCKAGITFVYRMAKILSLAIR